MPGHVTIADPFKSLGTTAQDLLPSEGFAQVELELRSARPCWFFDVDDGDRFRFSMRIEGRSLVLERNGHRCEVPVPTTSPAIIQFYWTPTMLSLRTNETPEVTRSTPSTAPPLAFVRELRRQGRLELASFASEAMFRSDVVALFQEIQSKVYDKGSVSQFWNGKRPKSEPELQPVLETLMSDQALDRKIDVHREVKAAGGELDFLFTGALQDGTSVRLPIECKLAHASDIEHGISTQLPEYMRALGCEFGVYYVLNFRGREWSKPTDTDGELLLRLTKASSKAPDLRIAIRFLDLSRRQPPSKR